MNGRDGINEELLSAYLDGETSSEERAEVESWLAGSAQNRRVLERMRWLGRQLDEIPKERLDDDFASRVLSRLQDVGALAGSAEAWSDELLSGYLDDELAPEQRAFVEQRLRHDADARRNLEELREIHADLDALPRHELGEAFTNRVLAAVAAVDQESVPERIVSRSSADRTSRGSSRRAQLAWGIAAVAAAVLLIVSVLPPRDTGTDSQLAENPQLAEKPPGGTVEAVPGSDTPERRGSDVPGTSLVDPRNDAPALADSSLPGPDMTAQVPAPSPMQMVSHLGTELLFVYEISVTPQGVEQDAFAQLLERHQISLQQNSYALNERQQQLLLRHRFLDGVQSIEEDAAEMDAVHVYLVSCKVNEAGAIYTDLMLQPAEFGSFFLNLTNRFAHDGVLNQICSDSGVQKKPNHAVELLGEFAILSDLARNLGAFGLMRLDLNDLILPPKERVEPPPMETNKEQLEATRRGEDLCEVLFVVRDLEPLADDPAAP